MNRRVSPSSPATTYAYHLMHAEYHSFYRRFLLFFFFFDQEQSLLGWSCAASDAFSYGLQPEEEVCKGDKYWKGMEALCIFGMAREYKTPLKWSFCLVQFSPVLVTQATKWNTGNGPRKGHSHIREHSQVFCMAKAESTFLHPRTCITN